MLCFSGLAARAEETDALIAKGDQFDQRLQAKEALEVYLPANKLEPNNVKLLVCIARQYRHLMSDTSSKQEKLRLGNISLEFASRAATLAPNNAEAQLSPAISLGKMLPFMASKDQIKAYGDLPVTTNEAAEKCLLKAIEINPNRLMHYIELGRIYAQMGRKEEARKYIQKGMAMPDKEKDDPEMKEIGKQTLQKLG